jgi:Ca-activated chloride channel family protein
MISDLDENQLRAISDATGGNFFRAADSDTIEQSFKAIDKAQKIEFTAKSYLLTTELFAWLAVPGAFLLFLGAMFALPPQLRKRHIASNSNPATPGAARSSSVP